MGRLIILAALESEFFSHLETYGPVFYTGIGKINAARLTTDVILNEKPDFILNVGTAGCLRKELFGEVIGVKEVVERDMLAEPLSPRGNVPFGLQQSSFFSEYGTVKCGTGDSFVSTKDEWLLENNIDLVDMELFSIAKVSFHYSVPWRAIKFASDMADGNSAAQWKDSLKESNFKISRAIESAIQK
jgi:adenosylhomocysteine nucleosidase